MKRKIIGCNVLKEELQNIPVEGKTDWEFLDMGLHDRPEKLTLEVQAVIDASPDYDVVILGYGLCGKGTAGLVATHCPLVIPKVHDCIPLLMGSHKAFNEAKAAVKGGTFFLSGGWTEGGRGILEDHQRMVGKYGPERTATLEKMIYEHYNRLLFINTSHPRKDQGLTYARDAAGVLELKLEEIEGRETYLANLLQGPWDNGDFLLVEKGATVNEMMFY